MTSISKIVTSFERDFKEPSFLHDFLVESNDLLLDDNEIKSIQDCIINKVISHMNQAEYKGLVIIDKALPICSNDVLSQHGLSWIIKSIEILGNLHSIEDLTLACKVLGSLIIRCKEIPELQKHISMHSVKQLINILKNLQKNEICGAVYYLIAVLLHHYPEVCERFQGLISEMIFLYIDSTQENMVSASARCYVLLSKATERSFKSLSTYTRWTYNEALLCKALNTIMDELYFEELTSENIDIQDKLELPSISDSNIRSYYNEQKQRFSNLCIYLSSMLRGYEAKNSVMPNNILQVLCRGLATTPLNIQNEVSVKKQRLYMILPTLHISLLTVLDAFINGFRQELIPFGKTILQLFQQTLQWTNPVLLRQKTLDGRECFRDVRVCAYKCLSSWLIHTASLSGIETIVNECVSILLKDITPEKNYISLNTRLERPHYSKNTSKQKRMKYGEVLNKQIPTKHSLDADLCREALITLQNILFSGGVLLNATFYKDVQKTIIDLLYDFYLGTSQSFYKDYNDCRLQLYKVLKALQMNPHIALVSPIQHYIEISEMAARDIDIRIIQEAKLASVELEKIVHPIGPTLQLSRQEESYIESVPNSHVEEIREDTTSTSDKRKMTEEESESTDIILSVHKRPKMIALEYITKNTEKINSVKDIDKSQVDENLCDDIEEGIEDTLQKPDEIHHKLLNVTESRMECDYENIEQSAKQQQKEQNIEREQGIEKVQQEQDIEQLEQDIEQEQEQRKRDTEQEQYKNSVSCTDTSTEEKIPPDNTNKIQWEILQNYPIESEQLSADTLKSISLFCSEV